MGVGEGDLRVECLGNGCLFKCNFCLFSIGWLSKMVVMRS